MSEGAMSDFKQKWRNSGILPETMKLVLTH